MANGKRGKRGGKKKRVAAHIKDAAGKRAAAASSGDASEDNRAPLLAAPLGVGRPKRPREPAAAAAAAVVKGIDPARQERERAEATNYLTAWLCARKAKEAAEEAGAVTPRAPEGIWKFSTKTQGWLLRNLFSEEQVGESNFATLCIYMIGLKGGGRTRVLAEAQQIIDKNGPDEEEEQTAAAREAAAAPAAAAETETVDETAGDENETDVAAAAAAADAVPSGYNSDSTEEGEESKSGGVAVERQGGNKEKGLVSPPAGVVVGGTSGGGAGAGGGEFSFSFFSGNADGSKKLPDAVVEKAGSDESSSDSDDGEKGGVKVESGVSVEASPAPVVKKPRKARSALTGQSKADAKARSAAVAYERALQVAELLS